MVIVLSYEHVVACNHKHKTESVFLQCDMRNCKITTACINQNSRDHLLQYSSSYTGTIQIPLWISILQEIIIFRSPIKLWLHTFHLEEHIASIFSPFHSDGTGEVARIFRERFCNGQCTHTASVCDLIVGRTVNFHLVSEPLHILRFWECWYRAF